MALFVARVGVGLGVAGFALRLPCSLAWIDASSCRPCWVFEGWIVSHVDLVDGVHRVDRLWSAGKWVARRDWRGVCMVAELS